MKKLFAGFLIASIVLLPSVVSANTEVQWDLTGTYTIVLECFSGCTYQYYTHIMNITDMNMDTGEFSGNGYYNPGAPIWTVTGNFTDCSEIDFTIDYESPAYFINVEGTISNDGSMSGKAVSSSSQTFEWETTDGFATVFPRDAEITAPEENEIVFGLVDFGAYLMDDDYDGVKWAVRKGTCKAGVVEPVFGNVGSHTDDYSWVYDSGSNKHTFMATADTCEWDAGKYCFIFNPVEDSCEADIRLTRWFYVVDRYVSGGGQLISKKIDDKPKDGYKISFGGAVGDAGADGLVGEWQVNFHNVSDDDLDKAKFHTTSIDEINFDSGNGGCFAVKFIATGVWNGTPDYKLDFRAEDAGEPGCGDNVRIQILNDGGGLVYDTRGSGDFPAVSVCLGRRTLLEHGNLQMGICSP